MTGSDQTAGQPAAGPGEIRRRSWRQDGVVGPSVILGAAVGVFGLSFGVLASASGLSVAQACAMSLLVFTGASQFTAIAVVAGGGSPLAARQSCCRTTTRAGTC